MTSSSSRVVKDLQINNVIFEVNSKRVVENFNKNKVDEFEFGPIISDCRHVLSFFFFTNSWIEFIRRQTNEIAYCLAKVATSYSSFHVFYRHSNMY